MEHEVSKLIELMSTEDADNMNLAFTLAKNLDLKSDVLAYEEIYHFLRHLNSIKAAKRMGTKVKRISAIETLTILRKKTICFPNAMDKMLNLKTLYLFSNEIKTVESGLGKIPNLEKLVISNNLSLKYLPEDLGDLKSLEELNLSSNRISKLPKSIGQLSNLKSLDLSGNRIVRLPENMGNLSQLNYLNLSHNQLVALPESLAEIRQLQSIILTRNNMTEKQLERYQNRMPNCRFDVKY